ncbi:MAG: hypothetical protein HOL66_16370 [Rhodospirillaceae bacterium]|jgi:hypothetical protein|nr:hypothetical protein [Rhodospirillaceae bacterium]MBT5245807.1 hypothetical protein [Rhodospirillaceae bacterium]MBT5561350.1 hypothetical protein [Rhodospirillaceae bacterium]MBT6242598.1 hypothetical protein [Rhodospirillaceae bacterium]MBT7136368.1 hypothetical protein [Rhodospirillaceae bacterium]
MALNNPLLYGLKAALLVALVLGWHKPVHGAELDCGSMANSLNTGDHYIFKLEIQSQKIRLEKGDDFCTEPAKDWFGRQLILPAPAREEMPLPKAQTNQQSKDNTPLPPSSDDTPLPPQDARKDYVPDMGLETDTGAAPLPIAREFVKPKPEGEAAVEEGAAAVEGQQPVAPEISAVPLMDHVSSEPGAVGPDGLPIPGANLETPAAGVAAPPPPLKDKSMVKRCDRDLVSFWSPGEHVIEGHKFWLSGVFTIDLDSDGRVDDVGFKIKAEGKIGNILNYFPSTEGRVSGKTVNSLKLEDDRDIHRLCPGNVTFERADVADIVKQKRKLAVNQVKALPAQNGKKTEEAVPEEEPEQPEEPEKKTSNLVLIVAAVAMVMLLAGGIGLAMALRNITRSRKDEYEDDDDDDEDED